MAFTYLPVILVLNVALRVSSFVTSNHAFATLGSQRLTTFRVQQPLKHSSKELTSPTPTVLKLLLKDLNFLKDDDEDDDASVQRRILKTLEILHEIKSAKTVKDWVNILLFLEGLKTGDLKKVVGLSIDEKKLDRTVAKNPMIDEAIKLLGEVKVNPPTIEYAKYPNHREFPNYNLYSMMKMLDGVPPLEYFFSARKVTDILIRSLKNMIADVVREDDVEKAPTTEEKFKEMFTEPSDLLLNFHPRPACIDYWEDDKYVARQFLCGVNPVMIRVAKKMDDISADMVNFFKPEYLQEMIDEQRLLYVSYDDLLKLSTNPHQAYPFVYNEGKPQDQSRYFYAPFALFLLDQKRQELDILGIQLERKQDARIYTRSNSEKNEWLFVKSCLTNADSQFHEWVSHLGGTHLTMEPHIIAIHNTLKKRKHPIYTFLRPLCKDTLILNWGARQTLAKFGADSFGDYTTSVGTGQFMQLIQMMWSRYSFFEKSSLPSELASRGFDKNIELPAYLYREDGMKLWNAYGEFASNFVSEIYSSDAQVAADIALQEWAKETTRPDRAAVPGFPSSFQDKSTLVSTLQTLMWITSGLHAAVNFPQYDYYSYAPNKPLNQRAALKPSDQPYTRDWLFSNNFPHISNQIKTLDVVYLLTLPSDHCIDDLDKNFSRTGQKSYEKFKMKLKIIQDEIERRNRAAAKQNVYNYLNPKNVPASIDI